ncbi:MAG: hypothetical protein K8R77_10345 [Anaerolineaceae bacterium]|nr:hypothetical protein [Anaerolineaceae bacterium]
MQIAKAKMAVLRTKPETVLDDYQRLCELAGIQQSLDSSSTTIIKDDISWHLLYPSSNTTPWQLEGTILGLKNASINNLVDVHNKTAVTIADPGDKYNKFGPVLEKYDIPKKYNFNPEDMSWLESREGLSPQLAAGRIHYKPKAKMAVLDHIRLM